MTLTPTLKFIVIATAFVAQLITLAWTGIKVDALALNLNEHVYNIVLTVTTLFNAGMMAMLAYLGLKAPVLPKE